MLMLEEPLEQNRLTLLDLLAAFVAASASTFCNARTFIMMSSPPFFVDSFRRACRRSPMKSVRLSLQAGIGG
jgi:ABC-type Co2+ transport system permease subunit